LLVSTPMPNSYFNGKTISFLKNLQNNNNRVWFNEHKQDYEDLIRTPAFNLINTLKPTIKSISPHYNAIAKKTGGALIRVYRDVRFAKDKTPYKTHIGLYFKHALAKNMHTPGFYIHIHKDECLLGVGTWRPDGPTLHKIRDFMIDNPNSWKLLKQDKGLNEHFELTGERLKRPPRGFPPEHELVEDLKRKEFVAIHNFDLKVALRADFPDYVADKFTKGAQLVEWLCEACDYPY